MTIIKDPKDNWKLDPVRAYKKLKQDNYYDSVDLFLRERIAVFEQSSIDLKFKKITSFIESIELMDFSEEELINSSFLKNYLSQISFKCLPKTMKEVKDDPQINFISNDRSHDNYEVSNVNYFIDSPIVLNIIDVIWTSTVGRIIDSQISLTCIGNRLEKEKNIDIEQEKEEESSRLFKIYHFQYQKWRDNAIQNALTHLDLNQNIYILGLDFKQCYYHLEPDWETIFKKIDKNKENIALYKNLTRIIKIIYETYSKRLSTYINFTHTTAKGLNSIPIGYTSSRIISNFMLDEYFDKPLKNKINPFYYGRYVDDILLVISKPSGLTQNGPEELMEKIFIDNNILKKDEKKSNEKGVGEYRICEEKLKHLVIQKNKLVIQYFDHNHSRAGLTEFKKEIDEQASEFRFLPSDDGEKGIDDCAYDVIYKGSINKLRSVIGLSENSTELSKYLSRRIIQHRLSSDKLDDKYIEQLFRFYKGRNIFDFCRLWEKVFSLFITNSQEYECYKFYKTCEHTINLLSYSESIEVEEKLKEDTKKYLQIALAIPIGLLSASDVISELKSKKLIEIIELDKIDLVSKPFRLSNLIRHQFVSYPLYNFSDYKGNLIKFPKKNNQLSMNKKSEEYSPRYIYNEEKILFDYLNKINSSNGTKKTWNETNESNKNSNTEETPKISELKGKKADCTSVDLICFPNTNLGNQSLCIGVANIKVFESDIEASYHPRKYPNLSYKRQAIFYDLINAAIESPNPCDLIIFPEVSVPYQWLPFMVEQSRKLQLGMIFGLEHWVSNKIAYNLTATILPYQNLNHSKSAHVSLRPKNYYSPSEKMKLTGIGLETSEFPTKYYELFCWKGFMFTVYNCFELTNVEHRGIFKSELDFLTAITLNKDVHYFSNIIESSCRDLHCYIVQANTSDYGDSRIVKPTMNETMNILRIKGGENHTLMKTIINFEEIRLFQSKEYDPEDKTFKPAPAGYDNSYARCRGICEKCRYK